MAEFYGCFSTENCLMNVLKELAKKASKKETIKTVLEETTYCFYWNAPATTASLEAFEIQYNCILPTDYKDFLLISNGAVIFKSEHEDDGYKLLGLEEIENETQELRRLGYDIPNNWYCFIQCLFNDDILLFDLQNSGSYYIIDGDVGYPPAEWKRFESDVNKFFIKLFQCNGSMYWRW